jgi:hypothetical protein
MPQYKERRKDCKYYVEQGLRSIGYKVNSTVQEKLGSKECYVIYTKFGNEVLTQQSYWSQVFIEVVMNVQDNNDIPFIIDEVLDKITKFVEESQAPQCTSFIFGDIDVNNLGTTSEVVFNAKYKYERDWIGSEI